MDIPSPRVIGVDTEVMFRRGEETIFLAIIPLEGIWPNLTIHSPNDYSLGVDAHRGSGTGCRSD